MPDTKNSIQGVMSVSAFLSLKRLLFSPVLYVRSYRGEKSTNMCYEQDFLELNKAVFAFALSRNRF